MSGTMLGTSSPAVPHKGRPYPECLVLTVVKAAGEGKAGTGGRKLGPFAGGGRAPGLNPVVKGVPGGMGIQRERR